MQTCLWHFTRRSALQVWDASAQIAELATAADERPVRGKAVRQAPRHAHSHAQEGYALDWSPVATGRLASGDSRRNIHVWEAGEHGGWTVSAAYPGHEASVEDLQWSPTEATVFISASVRSYSQLRPAAASGFHWHVAVCEGLLVFAFQCSLSWH